MAQTADDLIRAIRAIPEGESGTRQLVAMLRQDGRHFQGLSAIDVEKVRGNLLASFEHRMLPSEAVSLVKEELRTSHSPIVLAGAARALRGFEGFDPECQGLLREATQRIELRDEFVHLDAAESDEVARARTARTEIASVIDKSAERACCCGGGAAARVEPTQAFSLNPTILSAVSIEDQAEQRTSLLQALQERVSLIAFFYTRCMTPTKCSLTISRLAAAAGLASSHPHGASLSFWGLSYDPDFDTPSRLSVYGRDRGFPFGDNARLARCTTGWAATRRLFELQVGYNDGTVNAHARELFFVSPKLKAFRMDCELLSDPVSLLETLTKDHHR